MKSITTKLAAGFIAASVFTLGTVHGQDEVLEEDVVLLEEVEAEDVPIEESILATTRPISSVYGTDRSILDTPRNVNIVSREQLDAISIRDVRDFSKLTSSSYTKTNFGAPTTPNLRGQEADLFINGMRRGMSVNGNGVPINFNSVESVNIVKGPAGAVFGTSNYVGGYADLITKRAYFSYGGSAEYTYGSFNQHTVDLDVNIPISETMAFRTSIQAKEWDGFWENWYDKSQAVYATFAWRPNDKYRLDVMGEYYKGNYTENWGVNRVTDDLLEDGLYIPNASPPAGPPVGFGNFPGIDLDTANPVKAERDWKLAAPGDDSNATVFWLQALQEYRISDTFRLQNNTYFHYKDRQTFSSYHYSELQRDNWSLENRLQAIQTFDDVRGMDTITLNYGIRTKYQDIWAVNHFAQEPVNYFDMTLDPDTFRVPDSSFAGNFYVKDESPRGNLDFWYVDALGPAASDATDSQSWIIGPFFQADFELTDKISVLLGYTIDYVDHEDGFPTEVIPLPGDPAAPAGFYDRESESTSMYNANASIVFKPTEKSSIYATANLGEHTLAQNGGAINIDSVIEPSKTELFELGYNASLFDDKVYLGAAIFHQKYEERDTLGNVSAVRTNGFELEINYQPNRNFFATIGYSFLDSERQPGFFATSITADDVLPGELWLTPTFPGIEDKFYENPGVPKHLFNALAQYQFDNGFGVQANIVVTSSMEAGYDGATITSFPFNTFDGDPKISSATLPTQFEIDAKIFYEYENWRFEFAVFNVTDEENWDLPNTGYANGSAVARAPTNYEFSVRYTW
jgi:outer membrane receptor for monomeric catechols